MDTIIAYDCSGSTNQAAGYHSTTRTIVKNVLSTTSMEKIRVIIWNETFKHSSLHDLDRINSKQFGSGGTSSSMIAKALLEDSTLKDIRLIVISDGEVDIGEVDRTEMAMQALPKGLVKDAQIHLIGRDVNMSVSCAFTRNCPHTVNVYDQDGTLQDAKGVAVQLEDLQLLDNLSSLVTLEDIEIKLPAIERAITARMMGRAGDSNLASALVEMRKRVVSARAKQQGSKNEVKEFIQNVRTGKIEDALVGLKAITTNYFQPEFVELGLEERISRLVSACEGSLRHVFTKTGVRALKLDRATLANPMDVETLDPDMNGSTFPCPLTLEMETDMILLFAAGEKEEDILSQLDVKVVDNCIQCPLAALGNVELMDMLMNRIDVAVSLQSIQESMKHGRPFMDQSPFTRRSLVGGLALGESAEHAKATDWTIARALTKEAKILGNPDLWFAVLWMTMEQHWDAKFERLGVEVRDQLRRHMLWRLRNRTSFASLQGLSHVVTTRLPLDCAIWFTLASCASHGSNIPVPATSDPLRAHVMHMEPLLRLSTLAGLRLPNGVEQHGKRLRVLLHMLGWVKREEKGFRDTIRALSQAHIRIRPQFLQECMVKCERYIPKRFLFVDGPVTVKQRIEVMQSLPPTYLYLPVTELVHFAGMVKPSQSANEVSFAFNASWPGQQQVVTDEWTTGKIPVDFSVPICPLTLRPYSVLPRTNRTWREAAGNRYGSTDLLLSTYKWMEDFIFKYNAYPVNVETFLVFMYNRIVVCVDTHTVLPASAYEQAKQTLEDLRPFMTALTVDEFKKLLIRSRLPTKRLELENEFLSGVDVHTS